MDVLFERDDERKSMIPQNSSQTATNTLEEEETCKTEDPITDLKLRTDPESKPRHNEREQEGAALSDITSLRRELEQLEDKMKCKICLDAEVDQLFLPCRHIICCGDCARKVARCPVCREIIQGTVNVILS